MTKTCGECKHYIAEMFHCQKHDVMAETFNTCEDFEPKVITNGDKIRQMSNADLAIEFATITDCGNCDDCPVKDYCTTESCDPIPAWIAYLNAPAESEGEDD